MRKNKYLKINLQVLMLLLSVAVVGVLAASNKLVGQAAPDFTLRSDEGDNKKLSELRGKVVMLNFWATWCGPCQQEIPKLAELKELHDEYDFELLGINIDEDPNKALRLAKKLSVNFPILFDQAKQVSKTYSIDAMPMTILIDRDGTIRYVHRGYKENYVGLYQEQIQKLKFE